MEIKKDQELQNMKEGNGNNAEGLKTEAMTIIDKNNTVPNSKKAASLFELQYTFIKTTLDKVVLVFATLGSLAMGVALPLFSVIMGSSINSFGTTKGDYTPDIFLADIKSMCLKFLYVGIGIFFGGFFMIWLWNYNGRTTSKRIKKEYFKLLLKQEQGYFDMVNPNEFATKLQTQIKTIEMGLGDKIGNTLMAFSCATSSFIIGFTYSWKLALVLIGVLPFLIVGATLMVGAIRNSSIRNSKAYEEAGGIAEEILYQIKTVASFANFEREISRFNSKLEQSMIAGKSGAFLSSLTVGFLFFLIFVSYTLAVWFGSRLIADKEYNDNMSRNFQSGDVLTVLFTVVFGAFSLGQAAPNIKAVMEAMNASYEFFELRKRIPKVVRSGELKPEKETLSGKIEFKNIFFAYPSMPDKNILEAVNFDIEAGKTIAIVGPSGSGKSTIVNLLERLYEVSSGEIFIDTYNTQNLEINYLRSLIGYVAQEPVLFNTTIRENIIFGRENITDEQILSACKEAYVDEFLSKWSEGLDYVVGIKGSKLSGGQKQRIAIARAILTKPKILILDEATSALDNRSEKEVQRALMKVSKGVTTVIIAHRLSTIMHADKIIVVKAEEVEINGKTVRQPGKIVEQGNHNSLLELNGVYANLVKSQVNHVDTLELQNEDYESIEINQAPGGGKENKNLVDSPIKKRRNSIDDLQSQLDEEKRKKEATEKIADSKRTKLWPILKEYPCLLISSSFFASCSGAVWPVYGILLADAIDGLSSPNSAEVRDQGFLVAMYFLILAGVAGVSMFFQNYLFVLIGENLTRHLRQLTFTKYLRLHMEFYDRPENVPGSLTTRLSSDTTKINGIALSMVGITAQTISTLIIATVLGFYFDWRLSLINLAFLPLTIITSVFAMKMQQGFSSIGDVVDSSSGGIVSECICNTKTIFSYNMQETVVKMYRKILKKGFKTINKTSFVNGILFGFSQFCMFATYSAIFFAGGSFIYQGTLTIKNLFRAMFSLLFAGFGLGQSQQYVGDISTAKKALVNIFSTLDEESKIDPIAISKKTDAHKPSSLIGKIEFRNVSFSYPTRPEVKVLKNVNFIISAGSKVAFVGASGSGKSTIIQLIERFYDVDQGEILIDEVNIKDYDLITLRTYISLVMQEPVIFKTDIFENIRYGKIGASDEEVKAAAMMAEMHEYIKPEYDKKVIPVSGGEKQRIAIARAMIKNPRILLLDEATSALDSENEKKIQACIDKIMHERTSITIAHKLVTILNSDLIFVMDQGSILEQGTHIDLLEKKGKYYSLYMSGQSKA